MRTNGRPVAVISVVRTGGFAGLRREWTVEIDDGEWPDWQRLVDACPWDSVPDDPAPDRFVYLISVPPHSARVPERRLTGPWRELADRVRDAHARRSVAD